LRLGDSLKGSSILLPPMIRIDFTEPTTEDWKTWRKVCAIATTTLVADVEEGKAIVIKDAIYKEQNTVYMDLDGVFHGKCAYCESLMDANQPGDTEHFRPKKSVTDRAGKAIMIDEEDGTAKEHPGYYWLAYDWRNLLPSCSLCNRVTKLKTGERIGKGNYFPVRGFRAINPAEETKEEPLLINPLIQDPSNHLGIDDTGVFIPLTAEGEETIKALGLNTREALVDERKRAYESVGDRLLSLIAALLEKSDKADGKRLELSAIRSGERAYSAAAFAAINNLHPFLRAILNQC
jgi:hypothetical protein